MRKILEKSLSRIYNHMQKHDCGLMTAYRSEYSSRENQQRNRSLLAKLLSDRYSVTSVEGSYIENYNTPDAIEVGEHTFFIADISDKGSLKQSLITLGKEFNQDSVLFLPIGGEVGLLIGTSDRDNAWPGLGSIVKLQAPIFGKKGEFFTKVRNRPFTLSAMPESVVHPLPESYFGRYACKMVADSHWSSIEV